MPTSTLANVSRYRFEAAGLDENAFQVVRFSGREAISEPFYFELELVSTSPDIDFGAVVGRPAAFTLMREDEVGSEPLPIHGVVTDFQQSGRTADHVVYQAVLRPRLWRLGLTQQSRVFQEMTVEDIVREVLKGAGLGADDVRFTLQASYAPREYCVQYNETDLEFFSRLLEFEGIAYFFEQDGTRDRLVITDDRAAFGTVPGASTIVYREGAGFARNSEAIQALTLREKLVAGKTVLSDYNYRTPDVGLEVESAATDGGDDEALQYEYGEHYKDVDQGKRLARVRVEELAAQRQVLEGQSDSAALRAGHRFTLSGHYRTALNADYLLTEVRHEGSQAAALGIAGVVDTLDGMPVGGDGAPAGADAPVYSNHFKAIPARVPFRPARKTVVPTIPGLMTAKVETAGGPYAYIDDDGRYRAKMPFDRSGKGGGTASRPIRMAQPYSGPGYGMHFPNHAGTELVWACVDGNPDRPLALGTVPNPSQSSPAVAENRMQNVIRTFGGNELIFDDTDAETSVRLASSDQNALLLDDKEDRAQLTTTGQHLVRLDDANEKILVQSTSGHLVVLDDKNEKVTLQSQAGHFVTVDDAGQKITIADSSGDHSFTIDIGAAKLLIQTTGSIDMHAPDGVIDIKATELRVETSGDTSFKAANIKSEAGGDYTVQAVNVESSASMGQTVKGTQTTVEGAATTTVKGATTNVEGGAMTNVKGPIVNVG